MNKAGEPVQTDATPHQFNCRQCGAQLSFTPGTSHLACNYCGHRHDIVEKLEPILERDFYSSLESLPQADAGALSMMVKCGSCAAEFEFDSNVHADECPFCDAKIVADSAAQRHIRPWALLPFNIAGKQALEQYRKWLKNLWFAPNKLKKHARQDSKLNGMYIPYWTFDSTTYSSYRGERGVIYYVPVQVRRTINGRQVTQTRMVAKIRWTPAAGSVSRAFDDVLVLGSNSLPRSAARQLEPWDFENLRPYTEEYLSGFRSELYQIDFSDGFEIARERMHPVIASDVKHAIGGDHQRIHHIDTQHSNILFKLILPPIWVAGYRFRNKLYQFIINGRSGKVQGERPYSIWKIIFAGLIAMILIGAAVLLFGQTQTGYQFQ